MNAPHIDTEPLSIPTRYLIQTRRNGSSPRSFQVRQFRYRRASSVLTCRNKWAGLSMGSDDSTLEAAKGRRAFGDGYDFRNRYGVQRRERSRAVWQRVVENPHTFGVASAESDENEPEFLANVLEICHELSSASPMLPPTNGREPDSRDHGGSEKKLPPLFLLSNPPLFFS